jgi:hypothetical protein
MKRLFRNYSVQTQSKLVRDSSNGDGPTTIIDSLDPMMGPEIVAAYSEIAKDFITHSALVIGGTYIACRIVKALTK